MNIKQAYDLGVLQALREVGLEKLATGLPGMSLGSTKPMTGSFSGAGIGSAFKNPGGLQGTAFGAQGDPMKRVTKNIAYHENV